jgi:hypothetical protein
MKWFCLALSITACAALFGCSTLQNGNGELVTSAGKHNYRDGKLVVQVEVPDRSHVAWNVSWEVMQVRGSGESPQVQSWSESTPQPQLVTADQWAFYFIGPNELWFYDGKGKFLQFRGTSKGLVSEYCDPQLGRRAPKALKQWIEARESYEARAIDQ